MNLYSNGTIQVTPPTIVTTSCAVKMNEFPYDKKVCVLKFGRYAIFLYVKQLLFKYKTYSATDVYIYIFSETILSVKNKPKH